MTAHGPRRLEMVREKLETVQPGDEWYEALFPEAVDELEVKLDPDPYLEFLEELEVQHPHVFAMNMDWHARTMALSYVARGRHADLERVIRRLAGEMKEISDPMFSVISLLRLAGEDRLAQTVLEAAIPLVEGSDLMPWAVDELIEWAMFPAYERCVAAGATDEAIDEAYRHMLSMGTKDTAIARDSCRRLALHLAGEAEVERSREKLRGDGKEVGQRIYLLLVDFRRWLTRTRGIPAVASDEFRRFLVACLGGMDSPANAFLDGLNRSEFEPFLAGKLGFMSLNHVQAPATALGMLHFYDFLAETGLVDEGVRARSADLCNALWEEMKRAMKDHWWSYRFLERYLPEDKPAP